MDRGIEERRVLLSCMLYKSVALSFLPLLPLPLSHATPSLTLFMGVRDEPAGQCCKLGNKLCGCQPATAKEEKPALRLMSTAPLCPAAGRSGREREEEGKGGRGRRNMGEGQGRRGRGGGKGRRQDGRREVRGGGKAGGGREEGEEARRAAGSKTGGRRQDGGGREGRRQDGRREARRAVVKGKA